MAKDPIKITQKIIGQSVVQKDTPMPVHPMLQMTPIMKRPEELEGSTYKIKTPNSDHALYITINDVEIDGYRRPFEIFINSKNMENFSWIVALTRVVSAVFRHGGDVTFLVEELRSVFDPRGGYYKPGGKYMPSLVAEIGECIERHMVKLGIIQKEQPSSMLNEKRKQADEAGDQGAEHGMRRLAPFVQHQRRVRPPEGLDPKDMDLRSLITTLTKE